MDIRDFIVKSLSFLSREEQEEKGGEKRGGFRTYRINKIAGKKLFTTKASNLADACRGGGCRPSPRSGGRYRRRWIPGAVYDTFRASRATLLFISEREGGARSAGSGGSAAGVGGRALSLSLSLFPRFLCQPNRRTAPSVAFYPTSRIVRVPLSRGEPLASFSLGASFFRACYDFFSFLFFFLSEVILCATNLPVGCVLGGVLCRYLSPPPARNYSVVSRIFIARTSLHFPGGEGKFPLCNFSSFLQFLSRESSRLDHVSLITRVSLSLSLYSSVAPHFFFFFAPIKARCLHFSISPRIFLHRYSYITL